VGMAHAAAVDDIGHLHARAQLVGLNLNSKDGDGRGFHVIEDGGGHVGERARREVFENEGVERAAAVSQLRCDGSGDGFRDAVGDEGDLLVGLDAQTSKDGGAGSWSEFGGEGLREKVRCGCVMDRDVDAPMRG